ncbi:MAG: class I SAM-dependent RNA methyltransferase [Clostridia bacterium]|nr:class I SAM-dependent RNA methyltransferase [Clostridia bacterium]
MTTVTLVATCLFGLEKYLGEEIDALGCKRLETMDGRVTFEGDLSAIPRANLWLRCAERVFIKLGEGPAHSFTELYDAAKSLPWEDWIGKEDAFPVKGHSVKSTLFSLPDCQRIIKKAVAKRLENEYGISWFSETGTKYQIEFFLFRDRCSFLIDTSGIALHKRGYRPESVAAPLRETLAAAIVYTSRPRENVLLWDPFCGSGTIAVEAAMIMSCRAPGAGRRFISESFSNLDASLWKKAREEAASLVRRTDFRAAATDIDPNAVALTEANAARAGVGDYVTSFVMDARRIQSPAPGARGTIVTNPPYGERLMTPEETEVLYREIGRAFTALDPWQVYLLTSNERFERLYGRRADKVRKLYNGMIPCYLYQYFKSEKKRLFSADLGRRS